MAARAVKQDRPVPVPRAVSRRASFGHAVGGLGVLWRQPNARIHWAAAALAVLLGAGLGIDRLEWMLIGVCITLVLGAEALNTALELVVDLASPQWHALARDAKDVAAAGVLICSIGALLVGLLVFGPRLWMLVH